jgi:hypothetical protein
VSEAWFRAVTDTVVLLELAPDDRVDPDLAVSHLERLAHLLQGLDPEERSAFVQFVRREAEREGDGERGRVLRQLPEALGLRLPSV